MYFAVCEDNIADRKQTERLLKRQSDRIYKEKDEQLYIDCYGNVDSFMKNIQMYQALFIDMVSSEKNGFDILNELLLAGTTCPIIMCSSSIDYKALCEKEGITAANVVFLQKPIKVAELTDLVDKIIDNAPKGEPTVELRGKDETVYATVDDLVCAQKQGAMLAVTLSDSRTVLIIDDIVNFYDQCRNLGKIIPISDKCIVNANHIKKTSPRKVFMDNDLALKISFPYRKIFKESYNP